MINFQDKVSFIWSIAEILRGPYKPEDYGKIILPLAVLRRFDYVLESTKEEVLSKVEQFATMASRRSTWTDLKSYIEVKLP